MLAIIKINDFSSESSLLLPSLVIKQDLKGSYVYVVRKHSNDITAMKRYVKTGISYGDETIITEGLHEGDKVIVNGYNQVSDGEEVEVK